MIHPDDLHLLHDWSIYGPKNGQIAELVEALARRGMRVEMIEDQIAAFLRAKLLELDTLQSVQTGQPG